MDSYQSLHQWQRTDWASLLQCMSQVRHCGRDCCGCLAVVCLYLLRCHVTARVAIGTGLQGCWQSTVPTTV